MGCIQELTKRDVLRFALDESDLGQSMHVSVNNQSQDNWLALPDETGIVLSTRYVHALNSTQQ